MLYKDGEHTAAASAGHSQVSEMKDHVCRFVFAWTLFAVNDAAKKPLWPLLMSYRA